MTTIKMSRINFELGRIQGLVSGSDADVQEAVTDSVDTILDLLDGELMDDMDFQQKTEVPKNDRNQEP